MRRISKDSQYQHRYTKILLAGDAFHPGWTMALAAGALRGVALPSLAILTKQKQDHGRPSIRPLYQITFLVGNNKRH